MRAPPNNSHNPPAFLAFGPPGCLCHLMRLALVSGLRVVQKPLATPGAPRNATAHSIVLSKALLPDDIQKQLERSELADSLDRQGVVFERLWRATRTAFGLSGMAKFLVGEALVAAPTVLLMAAAILRGPWLALAWVPATGVAWWLRHGRLSCLGCVASFVASSVLSSLLLQFDRSPLTFLGGLCIPWTWWVGAYVTGNRIDAIVYRLANNARLYSLLHAEGSIKGPEHANVNVALHRSDRIDSA